MLFKRFACLIMSAVLCLGCVSALEADELASEYALVMCAETGEVLYEYPLARLRRAYILHNEEAGTVSFAVVNGERLVNHQLFPYFKDIEYASEIRASDLQLLRQLYIAVNETATDRIYSTAQHMFWMNHANLEVKYITRGITLEPERLEGQTVLFRTEIDGATVFCIESEEPRAIVTKEDIRKDVS